MKNKNIDKPFYPNSILVTGGCGFIGSNFIRFLLSHKSRPFVINLDCLTYAGNLENLSDVLDDNNLFFCKGDIRSSDVLSSIFSKYRPEAVVNFAAETHVDRSIKNPFNFFETNVEGTLSLLQKADEYKTKRYLQVSTDEVYGSLGKQGTFSETSPLMANSPYSASKASADLFVRSYNKTFGLDTIITRCSNNYGPYQFPEKLIPLVIHNVTNGISVPVYGDGSNIRDWIYVQDHCEGIWRALTRGKSGGVYNFGGDCELTNLDLVRKIILILNQSESLIKFVEDRKGHDFRYAIDNSLVKKDLGWNPKVDFESGIKNTINWYVKNREWLESATSGDYKLYYKKYYGSQ